MLKVSIHAGPLVGISRFNRVAWLDLGYSKLGPIADYKAILFETGAGARIPVLVQSYPRWSASLWDLIVRAIGLSLSPTPDDPVEALPLFEPGGKRAAFAAALSAVIEKPQSVRSRQTTTLGSAEIVQEPRKRGVYRARFEEDAQPVHRTELFSYAPKFLCPAALLLHAGLVRLHGQHDAFPPRPGLCIPQAIEIEDKKFIAVHQLVEPARSGLLRWLERYSESPFPHPEAPLGLVPETLYAKFLAEAI